MDPDNITPDNGDPERPSEERVAFARGLRDLGDFLLEHPDAPLPLGPFSRHLNDADDFDKVAAAIGSPVTEQGSVFEHCERRFGPVRYGVQTDGRKAQQVKRREEAIAQRERELGLSTEDVGQAA